MNIRILSDFIDLKKLEGRGEWKSKSSPIFSTDFCSLIFVLENDEIEILAYSETKPTKFIRYKDCIEVKDENNFLKLVLDRVIICREWYYHNKLYMSTFHDMSNENKVICRRFEPTINFKTLINIKLTSIFEIGFVATSSESIKEFNLF